MNRPRGVLALWFAPNALHLVWLLLALAAACQGDEQVAGLLPDAAASDEVQLEVAVRTAGGGSEVSMFEPFELVVDCYRPRAVEVEVELDHDAGTFVVDEHQRGDERPVRSPGVSVGGRWRERFRLRAIAGPGAIELPAVRAVVVARDGIDVPRADGEEAVGGDVVIAPPPPPLEVHSRLPADDDGAIEAPGQPLRSAPTSWFVWAGLGSVLSGIVVWLWSRRRPRSLSPRAEIAAPAHVVALRELARWRAAPRAMPHQVDAFYVGVSDVLRRYLEARFGLHAPERTTEEFLRELEGGDALAQGYRRELERFLEQCDLVKFAAASPAPAEHDAILELAFDFVEATRIDRVPPAGAVAS